MAKVVPQPIGSPLESFLSPDDYRAYRVAMDEAARPILEGREKVRDGWGQEYRDRVHKKGKLTAWERIERLKDPGSRIFPINTFVNYDVEFEGGKFCPGAGVVTAFVRVADRYTVVIANDNTVASGAWWPLSSPRRRSSARSGSRSGSGSRSSTWWTAAGSSCPSRPARSPGPPEPATYSR
ncbi:MAG: carboxyl transferase domain-containing protein [Planctomycetota bacterium]|jgi:hypothetical protein